MSYAAFKMMHLPTGIENCASGFITHCSADSAARMPTIQTDDLDADWPPENAAGPVPNLVVTAGNVLEIYVVRVQEEGGREARGAAEAKRGGSNSGGEGGRKRDSIILAFQDAKMSVLEFDDSIHGLRTRCLFGTSDPETEFSSMHCFEGPDWLHLKRGRESFTRGPLVKPDPQGRCAGVLVYGLQMIILKAAEAGSGLVSEENALTTGGAVPARVESSYVVSLRDLDMKHVKDFIFLHGYIEPVMVILHERELTWAGRVSWKHHTCMISALSISTTLRQHPLIWSAANLPHDAYKLLAVPSPIGGVLVLSANTVHYHSQSASCMLALNNFAVSISSSQEMPRSSFSVELDAANATWLLNDVAMLSTKTGELLLLTLVYDGRGARLYPAISSEKASSFLDQSFAFPPHLLELKSSLTKYLLYAELTVSLDTLCPEILFLRTPLVAGAEMTSSSGTIVVQRLDLSKSRASVLTSGMVTLGNSLFFLGSRLGDSLLVQFSCGIGASTLPHGMKEEYVRCQPSSLEMLNAVGFVYAFLIFINCHGIFSSSAIVSMIDILVADIEGDIPSAKRLRRSPSDALLEMVNGEELSLYSSGPSNAQSAQKTFSFAVRDSLINVGPLKDFSNGLRINADLSATGIAKQSNYELVCCSGHGKNGTLCVLQQSIRPETITQEQLPGCKGLWTVYHKNTRSHSVDSAKMGFEDDEYHAYLIISLETRTMVLEAASNLEEVTETVDYYVQGSTIAAGNLFGRRRVVQVFARGARILDGAFMTQDLSFRAPNSEAGAGSETLTVSSVAIADPYVLLKMTDGSIQLLVGGRKLQSEWGLGGDGVKFRIQVVWEGDASLQENLDPSTCMVSSSVPTVFESSKKTISACTLYHDKGPEPWLRKTSTDAWLSTGIEEAIDGTDGTSHDQGDIYCVVCYESGTLEIFDVPNFSCVFSVDAFVSGKTYLLDTFIQEPSGDPQKLVINDSEELPGQGRKENTHNLKVVELTMQRWSGQHSRPHLFGILTDGTILCYHAYLFEASEIASKNEEVVSVQNSVNLSSVSTSRLRNLRFVRVPLDSYAREETLSGTPCQRITIFKNVGGYQGLFLSGSRPAWFMIFRERLRVHPQVHIAIFKTYDIVDDPIQYVSDLYLWSCGLVNVLFMTLYYRKMQKENYYCDLCDGPIVAFAVLHNVNCNHGLIYVTSQGILKICQLPSVSCYDNYWPVQKIPLKCTPHQVTYFAEKNLYPLIVSVPVLKPLNQVLSSLIDQEAGQQIEHDSLSFDGSYSVDEFEVRIMEPEKSGGPWQTRATIPMQTSENALTVRVVTLLNTTTKENVTLLAIGTAYVQGEDVAARGRVLLFSVDRDPDNSQTVILRNAVGYVMIFYPSQVSEVYSKESKGAISALASLQGHLLIASGPKITINKWTGSELTGVAFFDVPALYVVSINIVKNFILLGDIHKSIYFFSWKEPQLSLLAKDFGSLDCFATEFLIDGSTLSLMVSDEQKNVQVIETYGRQDP
ncbi:hypothetical protein C3L33_03130, partial [Rhododendron williamsianum]